MACWQLETKRFGLFDTLGNCYTWCMDEYDFSNGTEEDNLEGTKVLNTKNRVLRGGSHLGTGPRARSSNRNYGAPTYRTTGDGFRLAKTP